MVRCLALSLCVFLLGAAPPSSLARAAFERGEKALVAGKVAEAEAAYREALAASPGYAAAHNGLGNALFKQDKRAQALAQFQAATAADPSFKLAYFNLGFAARKEEQFAAAARAYERYTQLEASDPDGYYGLAESYRELGEKAKAVAAYQAYLEREKRPSEKQWVDKAREQLQSLKSGKAPAGTLGIPSSAPAAVGNLAPQVADGGSSAAPPVSASRSADAGATAAAPSPGSTDAGAPASPSAEASPGADAGTPTPAPLIAPPPVPSANPALAAQRIADGDALMDERRYRDASFAYQDASHADLSNVEALFKLGNAYAVLGYFSQAVDRWTRVVELTRDPAIRKRAQDNIRKAEQKMGSLGASPQAAGQPPGSGPVADTQRLQARRAYEQGVQRIKAGDYAAAVQSLTHTLQLEPTLAVAFVARGSAYVGLRRFAEAATDYEYALKLEPTSASPLYGLAEAYRGVGRRAEARGLYERYAASTAPDVRPELKREARQKAANLR